ncbi:MAG: radical SAM protein, partial [Calditrichota bacterium]
MQTDYRKKAELLRKRLPDLIKLLDPCRLCPRQCMAERKEGGIGECGIGDQLVISSIFLHRGNEYPISGINGSGNIFLAGCNLNCVYCQNWTVSHGRSGTIMSTEKVAQAMLALQKAGAHNINCVTPTHVVPMLMEALLMALEGGLKLPFVYNCGGYESMEVLPLLDGIVDIYLPDMKYGGAENGFSYSGIREYPRHNHAAVREMYRQVGPLVRNDRGIARRGLLVRHLVLPNGIGDFQAILTFLDEELPGPVDLNIMAQYRP